MKIVKNEVWWDAQEACRYLEVSHATFYRKPDGARWRLHSQPFDGKRQPLYYKRDEVIAFKEGRLEERPHIVIRGLLKDWTTYARGLGLNVETVNCLVEIGVPLPREVCAWLGVPQETAFVKRQRISFVDLTPICVWSSYYPLVLVGQFLEQIKQPEPSFDIVAALKESKGITIHQAKDRYVARDASLVEQELLDLKRPAPILQLQRAAYSELGNLVLYSDMALLGSWFEPELEYPVTHW